MRCHTAFGSHLKEEVFITHLKKNDFLNNRILKRVFFYFSL